MASAQQPSSHLLLQPCLALQPPAGLLLQPLVYRPSVLPPHPQAWAFWAAAAAQVVQQHNGALPGPTSRRAAAAGKSSLRPCRLRKSRRHGTQLTQRSAACRPAQTPAPNLASWVGGGALRQRLQQAAGLQHPQVHHQSAACQLLASSAAAAGAATATQTIHRPSPPAASPG
jgi:hypothetical protein